ncbi:hypothetical protein PR048_010691 [Dryococelus australis]|uniref:PUL domain-containing protein n=1 Tax=Dryococelus australis TaxID=614101 RepID=A0ABQ9I3F0_9NEOP|nr:hypothetical protein PR048_010691 [Dryococelus australis]
MLSEVVFPVLDVARLAVRNAGVNASLSSEEQLVYGLEQWLQSDAPVACQMLTLRLLSNFFSHKQGQEFVLEQVDRLLSTVRQLPFPGNKNTQVCIPAPRHRLLTKDKRDQNFSLHY